jgi:hypothetical protein
MSGLSSLAGMPGLGAKRAPSGAPSLTRIRMHACVLAFHSLTEGALTRSHYVRPRAPVLAAAEADLPVSCGKHMGGCQSGVFAR